MNKTTLTTDRAATWRTIRQAGAWVLRSPSGEQWTGTATDVRGAILQPWNRDGLAKDIKTARLAYRGRACYGETIKDARRCAILNDRVSAKDGTSITIANKLRLEARAAARYMGQSEEQFISEAILAAIEGTKDICQNDTGSFELPMTRHERAAMCYRQSTTETAGE